MTVTLDHDDVFWEQHTGGDGHRDQPEWSQADGARATAFYADTGARARAFLDLLIDRPGQLLDADWIADQILGSDAARDRTSGRRTVARSIRGMRRAQTESGRRYPFKWFEGRNGSPTRYGMSHLWRRCLPTRDAPQTARGEGAGTGGMPSRARTSTWKSRAVTTWAQI